MNTTLMIFIFIGNLICYYLGYYISSKRVNEIKVNVSLDKQYQKQIVDLIELRKLDEETIEDLQKRLEDAGLDSSIG